MGGELGGLELSWEGCHGAPTPALQRLYPSEVSWLPHAVSEMNKMQRRWETGVGLIEAQAPPQILQLLLPIAVSSWTYAQDSRPHVPTVLGRVWGCCSE